MHMYLLLLICVIISTTIMLGEGPRPTRRPSIWGFGDRSRVLSMVVVVMVVVAIPSDVYRHLPLPSSIFLGSLYHRSLIWDFGDRASGISSRLSLSNIQNRWTSSWLPKFNHSEPRLLIRRT